MIGAMCPCMASRTTHVVWSKLGPEVTHRCEKCAKEMALLGWLIRRAAPTEEAERGENGVS